MRPSKSLKLSASLAAVIGGVAASTVPLHTSAQPAMGFSPTETGQVLIFPYYTVNSGWQSFINVINTSESALAVKVRVHEYKNSRDVLDINVLMSPEDQWTAFLRQNPAGGAELVTMDQTCTSPILPPIADIPGATGLSASAAAYSGIFADGGGDEVERTSEGYVELLVMGECSANDEACFSDGSGEDSPLGIGYLTEHVNGTPRDCAAADEMFIATIPWDGEAVPGTGEPRAADPEQGGYDFIKSTAPLKGNSSYLNFLTGEGAGTEALHLEDVSTGLNLVTAQQFPWFLEPTIATAPAGVWDASALENLEARFSWLGVVNEWSTNPVTNAKTDWVVNFPTKGFHADQFCDQIQANNNRWRVDGSTVLVCDPDDGAFYDDGAEGSVTEDNRQAPPYLEPFDNLFTGASNQPFFISIRDREEGTQVEDPGEGTQPSPAPPPPPADVSELPWETNVIRVGSAESALGTIQTTIPPIDAPSLLASGATSGWMKMLFDESQCCKALPAYGFIMKTRDFGSGGFQGFGQMMDHGYILDSETGE
jgi:hypothetical protein